MKLKIKRISKYIIALLIIITVGIGLLCLSSMISKEAIIVNVISSYNKLNSEGEYPKSQAAYNIWLDNFTDTLMIDTAYSVDPNHPLESSFLMRRGFRENPYLVKDPEGVAAFPIKDLYLNLMESNEYYFTYARYWHGYMVFLRPMLAFVNYTNIRVVLCFIILALSLTLIVLTFKKLNVFAAITSLFFMVAANIWIIGESLQYSSIFIIMLLASIYLLLFNKRIKDVGLTFFIIGIFTSFFDLLTSPILTLSIPLVYYILLNFNKKKLFRSTITLAIIWLIGYASMWASKWILTDLLFHTNIIGNALSKVFLYTVSVEEFDLNVFEVIIQNMAYLFIYFIIASITLALSLLIKSKKPWNKENVLSMLFIFILPFVWTLITKNHSFVHARYTFRNYLVLLFILMLISMYNLKGYIELQKLKGGSHGNSK